MTPRMVLRMGARGWAVGTFGILLLAVGIVAAVRVPWSARPVPRAAQLAVRADLPPELLRRGRAFTAALRPAMYGSLVIGTAIAIIFGVTPLGARLVGAVGDVFGGSWVAQALLGGLALVLLAELVTLPLSVWRETVRRGYGLSTRTWGLWVADLLKGYAVGAVLGALALLTFFGVARLLPQWWWAVVAAGAAGLVALLSFVVPVVIEPIFNNFTPMRDSPLRTRLLALAERDAVPARDVLVADASRRTTGLNAYVSGLGPTRRIVVFDTLLGQAPEEEIESVVAHELGHARARDVFTATLLSALGAAAAVCAVYLIGSWGALLHAARVDSITDPRALALLIALSTVAGLVTAPLQSLVSRRVETRADEHALALTGNPVAAENLDRRLARTNLADVDPPRWEHLMFGSHPTVVERIAAARAQGRGER